MNEYGHNGPHDRPLPRPFGALRRPLISCIPLQLLWDAQGKGRVEVSVLALVLGLSEQVENLWAEGWPG